MMNRDSSKRSPVQKLRARLREATEEAILAAAEEVFAEQGLHSAKMEAIAERAGVAVGTLYNHFKDRAAMLDALMEGRREVLNERLDAVLEAVDGKPFREQLQAYVQEMFAHFGEHARFFHIVMQSEGLTASRKARSPTIVAMSRRLQTLIGRGVASGEVRSEDAEMLPALLMGMVRGALFKSLESERSGGLERWGAVLTEVFLRGVEVR